LFGSEAGFFVAADAAMSVEAFEDELSSSGPNGVGFADA